MKKYLPLLKIFTIVFAIMLTSFGANAITTTATVTGPWNSAATWNNGIPAAGYDVIINTGVTVTIDVSTASLLSLTINGTLTIGNNNTARTVTVTGSTIISGTGIFQSAGNGGNIVNIGGNLSNAGVFNMNDGTVAGADADVTFNGAANQTVSGAGATTDFNDIIINNTGTTNNVNNIVEITSTNFTTPFDFLTLTDGTFKLSTAATLNLIGNNLSIGADDGLVINNAGAVVNKGDNDITVAGGVFQLLSGTINVGNGNDLFGVSSGTATLSGGTLNVLGHFQMSGGTTTINGATINIDANVSPTTAQLGGDIHIFEATGAANVTFTSGIVTIIDPHMAGAEGAGNAVQIVTGGTKNFAGSTIRLGDGTSTTTGSTEGFDINSGTTPILGNLVVNNPSGTNRFVALVTNDYESTGNLTITGGQLRSNGNDITVGGNWTNNGSFVAGTDLVTFNGTAAQTIGGTTSTLFNNITFNNTLPGTGIAITVARGANVSGVLTFTDGIVSTDITNFLTLSGTATIPGAASNASHVDGPLRKLGNFPGIFRFPCGDAGQYEYLEISRTVAGTTPYDFTAWYNRTSATALDPDVVAPVKNVSGCDHWILNHIGTFPAPATSVTLSWSDLQPCGGNTFVTLPSALTVARLSGGSWSQAGTSGAPVAGSTPSSGGYTRNDVTLFSPFSLANTVEGQNPLPVTFFDVKAFEKGTGVQVEWTNLTEKDLVNYTIERSSNGIDFIALSQVAPRSNLNDKESYSSLDGAPVPGINFYRIKAVEFDGKVSYSKILKVQIGGKQKGIVLYPNPVTGNELSIGFTALKGQYTLRVLNAAGQDMYSRRLIHPGGTISQSVELPSSLKTGVYNLMITGDNYKESKMFIMQ
jgi:hypothetical protein